MSIKDELLAEKARLHARDELNAALAEGITPAEPKPKRRTKPVQRTAERPAAATRAEYYAEMRTAGTIEYNTARRR